MKLSAPKQNTWIIAVIVGVVGILANVIPIVALAGYSFWLVAAGFVVLGLATFVKGL